MGVLQNFSPNIEDRMTVFDIFSALKVWRFWVQTTVTDIDCLTLSRPIDNALPMAIIVSKSCLVRTGL
jgi:hypothetical protein